MIFAKPTTRGSGLIIYGDYLDLSCLYSLTHKISSRLANDTDLLGECKILDGFAYEIRHAYQKDREYKKFNFSGNPKEFTFYYGFRYLWTDILFTFSVLRHNAGYVTLDELDQSLLYSLEYFIKKSMFDYDPLGANELVEYVGKWINTSDKYIALINSYVSIEFLTEKVGKKRFRMIPGIIRKHSFNSDYYNHIIQESENYAKLNNVQISEIDIDYNDLKIIW